MFLETVCTAAYDQNREEEDEEQEIQMLRRLSLKVV